MSAHDDQPVSRGTLKKALALAGDGIRDAIAKATAPLHARIAMLEARVAELEAGAAKSAQTLESAERRLSRHAEHLARLETRVQKAER